MYAEDAVSKAAGGSAKSITPAAEFRRWLIIACVVPIAGTCLLLALEASTIWKYFLVCFIVIWSSASACEGWLQFSDWWRRLSWTLAGSLTGLFTGVAQTSPNSVLNALVFAIPTTIEIFTTLGVRRRPWAWLLGTLILYGSAPVWGGFVSEVARKVTRLTGDFLNYPMGTKTDFTGFTTALAVILITRAIIGSFIASRRQT